MLRLNLRIFMLIGFEGRLAPAAVAFSALKIQGEVR